MCGICGISYFNREMVVVESELLSMRDTMIHRGPDDAGFVLLNQGKTGLAHRRLSIIDVSPHGKQPMSNENGTIWIVFNGEIYNHKILRNQLIGRGHVFKSDSDTETIIHLFEEKGIDCIKDLDGEFAFGIYDTIKNQLWLVRDRIGVKPLYYTITQNAIFFASEIKAILADKTIPRKVNEEAFYHYLSFLTTPNQDTLFEGIKKLPCGCWLQINSDGTTKQNKYWDILENFDSPEKQSDEKIAKNLLELLRKTVQNYKMSDVPVGVFLSGGIDSSTNAILFSENENTRVKTFTVGYQGNNKSYTNEFNYANEIAQFIKSEHYEKHLNVDDLLAFLPEMIYFQDEPNADPVCVPLYYLSKLARDNGVKVCQAGEGSDELFLGYPKWKLAIRLEQLNALTPVPIKLFFMKILRTLGKTRGLPYEGLRRGVMGEPLFWGGAEAFTESEKKLLLSNRLQKKFEGYSSYEVIRPYHNQFTKKGFKNTRLNWMTYLDLNIRLPELLLMRVDKMSMAVSLETRVPFLNYKVVEYAMGIPENVKMRHGSLKYILKMAIKGIVPNNIIARKKQGFGIPIYEWFFDRLYSKAAETILGFCDRTDFFNKPEIERILKSKNYNKIWYLYIFISWHDYWIDKQ